MTGRTERDGDSVEVGEIVEPGRGFDSRRLHPTATEIIEDSGCLVPSGTETAQILPKPAPSRVCLHCKAPRGPGARFCTRTCANAYRRERARLPVASKCEGCGSEFFPLADAVRRGSGKYCSGACFAAHAKATGKFAGAQNPRWLGGVSADNMRYRRRQQERHPVQEAARRAVADAIRSGLMARQPCEVCGADKAHAHHDDHSKPLEVRWLCRVHHDEHHRLMGDKHNGPRRTGSKAGTARRKVT